MLKAPDDSEGFYIRGCLVSLKGRELWWESFTWVSGPEKDQG